MTDSGFFALISRMKYIGRWGLMRNAIPENVQEHSHEVAVFAHALGVISRDVLGKECDVNALVTQALYHDASEIFTGDLPTPIKYRNKEITRAYKEVEHEAAASLVELLPEDEEMRALYMELLSPDITSEEDKYIHKLVKAADKIAAYVKCLREESTGNGEFLAAKEATGRIIHEMDMPEVEYFMEHFVPSYGYTLDKITGRDD